MPPPPRAAPSYFPPQPLNLQANMDGATRERGASSIPCPDYNSEEDDFETWILQFENAVNVATNAQTADQSIPDVFASFSSADLIRNDIADMNVFNEEEVPAAPSRENIQHLQLTGQGLDETNPQPSTSGQANQSSILQPFRNFFTSFVGDGESGLPTPVPRDASTPNDN